MTVAAMALLKGIAADPRPSLSARQILEARLGPIGPIATMRLDIRRAFYLLAIQLEKGKTQ